MPDLPPRYESMLRLGAGGGGEVWSVRDRVSGRVLALKVLAQGAGAAEVGALVRETVALSGLEGLGVPRVAAFGALRDGRRYLVRDLVEGQSLDDLLQESDGRAGAWMGAIASACDQLTVVHRAGLLHGDIKPANIIVGDDGCGTLVDLGLAAPWRDGGSVAQGLTPKYAAPELFQGEALTVRAEVYALGATLGEALARRGDDVDDDTRMALAKVVARATERASASRWPSVDEFASAMRRAAGLPARRPSDEPPWPVLGLEAASARLLELAKSGVAAVAVEGPKGSGKTTLVRRLAWTLGIEGRAVGMIEVPRTGMTMTDVVALELAQHDPPAVRAVVIVDGLDEKLDDSCRAALRKAKEAGATLVVVAPRAYVGQLTASEPAAFVVEPLDSATSSELVQRSVPSLSDALRKHLVAQIGGRPGPLRAAVRRLAGRAIVSREDIDAALGQDVPASPPSTGRLLDLDRAERALDTGRFDEAAQMLDALAGPRGLLERVRFGLARARVAIGRGDPAAALAELAAVEDAALSGENRRAFHLLRARAFLRAGDYPSALLAAQSVVDGEASDVHAADALSVRGVALAFTGDESGARSVLDEAIRVARETGDPRASAVALGSSAIAHQRAGRTDLARAAYEASLAAAEKASDAATVATMRLNLAGMAQTEGDLALALGHLEAAVDMGRRAGIGVALTQAWLNLANLDLYLGRWARARGSIDGLAAEPRNLSAAARAQLLGLEAEHAARTGDAARGARLYEEAAVAWQAQGRPHDAAESRLEGLLTRAREAGPESFPSTGELEDVRAALGTTGFGEHAALAELVRATIVAKSGNEELARRALDAAIELATKAGRREWAWQALDARARLAAAQGNVATARRDTEAALAMLEETAAKLPRDLREVFWDDPRRRALRQAHTATAVAPHFRSSLSGAGERPLGGGIRPSAGGATSLFTGPRLAEDRLARILEITRELASEHDVPRLLQRVTDHAVALLAAERGFVLLTGENGELEAQTARSRAGEDDSHARFSRSVADRVVTSGEPVVTISARDDVRLAEAVSVHNLMIQSIACVPISGAPPNRRTVGALYLETRLRAGVRFEEELPTLRAFADQVAIAIENARLLSENRARADLLARTNLELEAARDEVAELLGKRTEQLAVARRDLKQVRAELRSHFGYAGLVGTSAAMRHVYAILDRVKDTDVPVLVTGESGTGKEIVARAIHHSGPRAKKPFLGLNCGAIPANLLESELFGSIRGAFTGADRDRRGLFQEADGGTLLLDEMGEMPPQMQAGLLRVLQEKVVRPVGSVVEEPVDVRVIASTHRDLEHMVSEGAFREDLFYRLHVIEIRVPPLRERVEDIPPLLDHFLSLFVARYRRERKAVSREALRKMCGFPWPGNVRQLEHVLLSAWLMSEGTEIGPDDIDLPSSPRANGTRPPTRPPRPENAHEHKAAERERILGALTACNWNRLRAAKMIGLPRRTFYRRLKEFGIE